MDFYEKPSRKVANKLWFMVTHFVIGAIENIHFARRFIIHQNIFGGLCFLNITEPMQICESSVLDQFAHSTN